MIPTYIFNDYQTQRVAAYTRPAIAYYLLKNTFGDELFKAAMKEYILRWNGKHPMPYDFFNTFDAVAGEDYSWFWKPWFFERGHPDLSIKAITDENVILIEKIGLFPVPVEITVVFEDNTIKQISQSARVWDDGKKISAVRVANNNKIVKVELGNNLIPDIDRSNNIWDLKLTD